VSEGERTAAATSQYVLNVSVTVIGGLRRGKAQPVVGHVHGVRASRAVSAATGAAAVAWATAAAARESAFLDKRQDLGNFTQAVWATAHGHFMQVTETGGTEVSRLGIHVDPIIAVFAPLWWLWPSPLLLLTVQAIALAVGALPLFWLGRKHLPRPRDAALLAAAYLLCPTVAWNAVADFHAVALVVPLLLFAIWYLDENRLPPFAATAGAAMLCQEQVGLIVGCLGLWYASRSRRIGAGLAVAATGFAAFAADFLIVLRHFSGGSPFAARFGGSPTAIVLRLFTHPLALAQQIHAHGLTGLLVAVPVLGFCFGSTIMLAATPQIALVFLSRHPGDWNPLGINVLVIIPFIYAATAFALARSARRSSAKKQRVASGAIFAASLAFFIIVGPFNPYVTRNLYAPISAQRQAVSLVPTNARVSATNHLALPLAARRYLYVFPVLKDADWVFVDSRDDSLPDMSYIHRRIGIDVGVSDLYWQPKLMRRDLRLLRQSPKWRLVYKRDSIYVFRRART
jgi:uncharacterized membrane protein